MAKLFTSRLRFDLAEIVENEDRKVEIEARLRKLTDKQIALLRENLENNGSIKSTSFTIDYYLDGKKRVTQEGDKYYAINKNTIYSKILFIEGRDIKVSIAYESETKPVKEPKNYKLKRVKDRISYIQDNFRVDITEVEENEDKRVEVELEVVDSEKFDVNVFEAKINSLYTYMTDTRDEVVVFMNSSLLANKNNNLKNIYSVLSRPRDLLIRDFTKDGLMENYTISVKADGLQKIMIFYQNKVYLFSLVDNDIDKSFLFLTTYENKDWDNTILIGEWVDKKNHYYDHDYIYLPFDCLVYQNKDIRKENYLQRLGYIDNFYEEKINNTYILQKKIFTYETNGESFYGATNAALDAEKEVKYKTDGLIFTPIYSPYITSGQKLSLSMQRERILSKYPDVCKYKPSEKLTIDFLVREDGLYSKEGKFIGNKKYPFTEKNYIFDKKYIGKIVEFSPKNIDGTIIYEPLKVRLDKNFPNRNKQIIDNWELIHDPITISTMRGTNVQLLRKYHNQIKSFLLEKIKGYVIDIGAGAGGVFKKYTANISIKKVLSIEPNKEFGKEFERRRLNLKKPEQFKLIEAGGEDTEIIIKAAEAFFPENFGENDLNICFHISLSFFWQNEKMLKALANTITAIEKFYEKRNGRGQVKIVYLTIEGERLKSLFNREGDNIKLNNILLRRMPNDKVFIDIKDSVTVHDQIEYLVYLSKLWSLIHFAPSFEKEADNQNSDGYILSTPELIYSKLFVYGIAEKGEAKEEAEKLYSQDDDCLYVSEKEGNKTEYGIQAKGDDERKEFKQNYHRLATLTTHGKIYHSLLKLLSSGYREADVYKRVLMAEDLKQKLRGSQELDYITKRLKIGIKIVNKNKVFGKDNDRFIMFYECNNGDYEPVIYHNNKDHMIFKPESFVLN